MRHRQAFDPLVDSPHDRSISFALSFDRRGHGADVPPLLAVGPGRLAHQPDLKRGDILHTGALGFPIQSAKVQCPALREDTLERSRLLEWLSTRIHNRVVLVTADAGYGKTTLLADFARRTRMRTLWYRLDDGDKDWFTFMSHLVAAGSEYDSEFAPETRALLDGQREGPTMERVVEVFLRELQQIASGGAAIILDDFHLVDDSPDCRFIVTELIEHGPNRLTTVFVSRQVPAVPVGRLRALGEVAELSTDDLRFDLSETTSLFNDTYGRGLESDVVSVLATRTEGWIASLQLVQAALRDRAPAEVRRFVANLTGADRELYDYLAEVVVGELPDVVQRFLMSTSVLQVVTPELAEVTSGESAAEVARLTTVAERLTLLGRISGGPRNHQRYHPLVREFLEARLIQLEGAAAAAALHRKVAAAASASDWRVAAHHYREAGDLDAMLETLDSAIPTIMANGQYALAEGFIGDLPSELLPSGTHLVLGRVDLQHGDYDSAARSARAVLAAATTHPVQRDHALLNLLAVSFNYGQGEEAVELATTLRDTTSDDNLRSIAEATLAILEVSTEHELDVVNRKLRSMAKQQRSRRSHHFGVSMFNLAANSLIQDRIQDAEREVGEALEAFADTSSLVERQAASVMQAEILLRNGQEHEAEATIRSMLGGSPSLQNDALLGAADAFDAFGSREVAEELLDRVGDQSAQTLLDRRVSALSRARILLRRGQVADAEVAISQYPDGLSTMVGMSVAKAVVVGRVAKAIGSPASQGLLRAAAAQASAEGIHSARRVAEILLATDGPPEGLRRALLVAGGTSPWHITEVAEVLVPLLPSMDDETRAIVGKAARMHPNRWRAELRSCLDRPEESSHEAAALLEEIGERVDILRLRTYARAHRRNRRSASLGRALARRLANPVFVEDQGRVLIRIGTREVAGSNIRRKVLAILCYLLTRPDASATRDQVLEAMWPDLDPEVATNSLNQTLYFLRRVFEDDYAEDLSPGYVHHEGDVIWLDPELVSSRTARCRSLIRELPVRPSPDDVSRLAVMYRGRFALDFEYEEWASTYRESVHAGYLEVVERSLLEDVATGHHDRAITIARRALEVDPYSDQIEVSLLRLYKSIGAHSAAAEQYAHYSSVMRDELGIEPPPLESL